MRNVSYLFSKLQIPLRSFTPINSARFNSNYRNHDEGVMNERQYKFEKCINEVKLLGRVGCDPVVSEKDGKPFIRFALGTHRKAGDPAPLQTDWHSIFTYDSELIKNVSIYVKKGKRVYISGKLSHFNDVHTDKKVTAVMLNHFICFS